MIPMPSILPTTVCKRDRSGFLRVLIGSVGAFPTNDTEMPNSYNYINPYVTRTINGVQYNESQRFYVSESIPS